MLLIIEETFEPLGDFNLRACALIVLADTNYMVRLGVELRPSEYLFSHDDYLLRQHAPWH